MQRSKKESVDQRNFMMILDEIIESISKEVIDEKDNIRQVIITILSSRTTNPQNLRILAPSGEGKTYTVLQTSQYFPQSNIWIISEASSKSFRYMAQSKVIEIDGKFVDFDKVIQPYDEQLRDKTKRIDAEKKIKEIEKEAYNLLDFTNKTIIFLDAQSFNLWESLKTTLSHDAEIRKDITTNKINGKNQLQRTAYKGYPAVIYCSAKDEISKDQTDEINTRFNTISIKGSTSKYKQMLKLVTQKNNPFYEQDVISTHEKEMTKSKVLQLIENIESFHGVFNPYSDQIVDIFPSDKGFRARQLNILSTIINLITLSRSENRYSLIGNEKQFAISSIEDVIEANRLFKKPNSLPTTKIQFFNEKIKPILLGKLVPTTAREIADELNLDRKKLLETYLTPFVDHGYLESSIDITNRTQLVFSVAPRYVNKEASFESTFIDTSPLDNSCLKSSIECRLEQGYKIVNPKGESIDLDVFQTESNRQ